MTWTDHGLPTMWNGWIDDTDDQFADEMQGSGDIGDSEAGGRAVVTLGRRQMRQRLAD